MRRVPARPLAGRWRRVQPITRLVPTQRGSAPIALTTAPGSSAYPMHRGGDILVCQVGSTKLTYQLRAVDDLATWLRGRADWVDLGGADENKPAAAGSVEAWAGTKETLLVGGTGSGRDAGAGSSLATQHQDGAGSDQSHVKSARSWSRASPGL